MSKQEIEVRIFKPSEERVRQLVTKAWVNYTMGRINRLPEEQRLPVLEAVIAEARKTLIN
ncbi:hypothetical protein [Petroclostridium sp. X23]|uniref:hypothetical protein n=1 Tax=Petroclostridium sp. X23 TaxID=3045146 RepID=UPI0024AD0CBD|nr:hypothetical protein [Petroclostridium sp. X23]WHH61028.1 hypothetical protein QKW49_10105 [Petroclostridium sp. X23]